MTFFGPGQTDEELRRTQAQPAAPAAAPPPGVTADHNFARRLKLVQSAAPLFAQGEGIKVATQLASSGFNDVEIENMARANASTVLIDAYKGQLTSIDDPWKQLQAWKAYDEGIQELLKKSGYVPPLDAKKPAPEGIGILTNMVSEIADAAIFKVLGVDRALKTLDEAAGIGTHIYRMGRLSYDEQGIFGMGGSLSDAEIRQKNATPLAVMREMKNLWNRTDEGETTFSVKSQERVRRAIGENDQFEFVIALAEGKSISDYLIEDLQLDPNSPGFEEQLLKYSQFQGQEDIQDSVKDLVNNKFSPGRDLASLVGLDRGTAPFNVVSGGIDAAFRMVTDPTLIGGKALKTARLSRFAISPRLVELGAESVEYANRINYLSTLPRFRRAADEIALGFRTGNETALLDRLPQLRGGGLDDFNNYLSQYNIARETVQADDVFNFFRSNLGTAALRNNHFVAPHFPGTILPSMSRPERFKSALAVGTKDWVSKFRLEDYGFDLLEPEQLKQLFGQGLKDKTFWTTAKAQQAVGDAMHSFYTKIPKYDFMGPDDSNGLEQFRAVLDYSMPQFMRDDYVNQWMRTTDHATRRSIYEAGVESMFHYSGALSTAEGKRLMRKALGRDQIYAADAIDLHDGRPTGIGEADLAEYWAVPDFRDMLKATAQTTMFRRGLDYTNEGFTNRFFANYWKPAVLLKAGFIPRAYGEEYLGFILREGPKAWLKSQAAITATKDGYLLPLRPVGWIADSLLSHIPLTIRSQPIDILAHNFADSTSQYVRGWANKLAPDEYVAAARMAAIYGGGIDGAVGQLGVGFGDVVTPTSQRVKHELIGRVDPDTKDVTYLPVRHGDFTTHQKGSAFHAHTVLREMRRMQSDRLFSPLLDAGRRQIDLDEGDQIASLFRDAGLIGERAAGTDYIPDLRKIRELVPDEVMPNFEAYLRRDSYASKASVRQDLMDAGMDEDSARIFVDTMEMMDTRQRVAILSRDGELDRMYRSQVLDPDAAFDVDSPLPIIRQGVEDEVQREYREVLEELWSPSPSSNAYWKISRRRLNSADMQETVRKSRRSRMTNDGRSVAAPPARGTRRVYTVVVGKNPVSNFEDLGSNIPVASGRGLEGATPQLTGSPTPQLMSQNPVLDAENGYIPFQSSEIHSMIPDHQPNLNQIDLPGGEVTTPEEMAWFTGDYAHAQQMHDGLSAKYKTQGVSIGYVDVPEDVFQEGQRLAKANASGGLHPLAQSNQANQVYIPKRHRENYQVLGEGNHQIIDGMPAVGATRDEAINDWATTLHRRYQQVFEAKDPYALREIQHRLLENRINVKDVADATPFLHESAIGAAIIEPDKENWFKGIVQKGFDVVGAGGNAMIRNQMYLHHYTQRLASETRRMSRLLGETGATETIEEFAARLGTSHYQLLSDWKSLPDDVRNAVNPVAAMVAQDTIPPSLREVIDVEDQKMFAEAWTAFYEHQNPDLLEAAEKVWTEKYVKAMGVSGHGFRDLQDSYISLDHDIRHSIMDNGYPPQIPPSFRDADFNADEWTKLRDSLNTNNHIYKTAHDVAQRAAINDVIPWIDDYRIRSQFQQHGRNLIPFWFSQENFIKRVANNVWRDPASIRKAQIAMDALHNSGIITQNQFGEDVYNIPLTGTVVKAVTGGLSKISGGRINMNIPVVNPMTGQLKYTIPGLDTFDRIGPSVSPLGAIPLHAVTNLFPELNGFKNAVLGERAGTEVDGFDLVLKNIMPSWAHKIYQSVAKDFGAEGEYASAMIQTAQMLEESGHGLAENATDYEEDDYKDRLENFTRMQMFIRGIVGFFSPAAPSTAPVEEFSPEFTKLLRQMPLEEAFMQFMNDNPTARAYTVVKTETPSKAPLSASEEAGMVIERHSDYFDKYQKAGPWLLPQSKDDTGFSSKTYYTQVAREMRKRKTLNEWYDDYHFAAAATDYFDTKEDYDLRMTSLKGNPQARKQLTDQYQTWKDGYLNEHKIFARLLNSTDAQVRRQEVLDQISDALNDPDAPDVDHKQPLIDLVDTYKDYQARRKELRGNTKAELAMKDNLKDYFTIWVHGYVQQNPGIRAFYDRIIRPEMGIID